MIRLVLELPAELVAFMVKVVVGNTAVGVPEMIPVEVSNDNPAGNEPPAVIDQLEDAPPVLPGVAGVIVVPTE
jgi:hypothetical protein